MKSAQDIFEILKENFPEEVISITTGKPKEDIIDIHPLSINKISFFLRDSEVLLFDNLILLSGVDNADGKKKTLPDGSFEYENNTLSVFYHVESTSLKHKITLRVTVPVEKPEVESVSEIWKCADWHEREAFDMIGINFLNHPNLIRILMPYDWEYGYPLRKDYKNPEFYAGMKVS